MTSVAELRQMSRAKLYSASILFAANCNDDALYLCGYAIEFALKAKVCENNGEPAWPETDAEFQAHPNLKKTHNFDKLLKQSGIELLIKKNHLAEWSDVTTWEVGLRYKRVGSARSEDSASMIESSEELLNYL